MATCKLVIGAQGEKSYEYKSQETVQRFLERLGVETNGTTIRVNGGGVVPNAYKLKSGDVVALVKNLEGNL